MTEAGIERKYSKLSKNNAIGFMPQLLFQDRRDMKELR